AYLAHQGVGAGQQQIHQGTIEAGEILPDHLHHVLHAVRERRHTLEAHARGHPLEGMGMPEERIDGRLSGCLLELDQIPSQGLQVLDRLGHKEPEVLGHVQRQWALLTATWRSSLRIDGRGAQASPSTFFTTARTSSARKGLTMKSAAPASMASITNGSCRSAEHTMITAEASQRRISRVASMPLLKGITMSIVVRSGFSSRKRSTASSPLAASPTPSNPPDAKMSLIMFRMKMASSTTRTRFAMGVSLLQSSR